MPGPSAGPGQDPIEAAPAGLPCRAWSRATGAAADELAHAVLRARYLGPGEEGRAAVTARVAAALAMAEAPASRQGWTRRFAKAIREGFIPAGRILAAAGRGTDATWVNCFVLPMGATQRVAADAGLGRSADDAVRTLRAGGGVGLDFSPLADPVAALEAFDEACARATDRCPRPGALMGMLRVEHPRILDFIDVKRRGRAGGQHVGRLHHFNLSVSVPDAFMRKVAAGEARAAALWRRLAESARACGEPGVVFIDTVRRDDSLADREAIDAVNPCGEQPLPAYGACCLGSIDLTRFVRHGLTPAARFDHAGLTRVARVAVRMLDNVIDLTPWPLPAQAAEARRTRRIGLGVTGLADALAMLGLRYSRAEGRAAAAAMLRTLRDAACLASVALARQRGPFPAFDAARYLAPPGHASRLPRPLQDAIARHGVRNAHRLSLAPAGSISLAMTAGVSQGVEPVWGWTTCRNFRQADGSWRQVCADDPVARRWRRRRGGRRAPPPWFETVDDITPAAQVAMVAALAPLVDGAISKTVQLPPRITADGVGRLLTRAWTLGIKGITVWRRHAPPEASPRGPGRHVCTPKAADPDRPRTNP